MIVDFHNHVIPAVDDGAQSLEEAVAAVAQFRKHGVTTVLATPHMRASMTVDGEMLRDRLEQIDAGFASLVAACEVALPEVRLLRGCELALDHPAPDLSDVRLRLNGSRFFLVEFPAMTVLPRAEQAIGTLCRSDYVPILAHPERYQGASVEAARSWKQAGALLQVNGPSLTGRFGEKAQRIASELLKLGLVDFISSDYHANGSPRVRDYREKLVELGREEFAETLMHTNPRRMTENLDPLPLLPLPGKSTLLGRMGGLFR